MAYPVLQMPYVAYGPEQGVRQCSSAKGTINQQQLLYRKQVKPTLLERPEVKIYLAVPKPITTVVL